LGRWNNRPMPPLVIRVSLTVAVAGAWAAMTLAGPGPSVVLPDASAATAGAPRGAPGARGPRGRRGPTGIAGRQPARKQNITINWQNGSWQGRDSASFQAPGIGRGEVVCNPGQRADHQDGTQWLRSFPADQGLSTVMWTVRVQDDGMSHVKKASRESAFFGPDFFEGMNRYAGEPYSIGSFVGIISSRGPFGSPGGAGPAPTTLRLSWHWNFGDGFGPRCYVAGSVISGG
jgi:hypothetical protein